MAFIGVSYFTPKKMRGVWHVGPPQPEKITGDFGPTFFGIPKIQVSTFFCGIERGPTSVTDGKWELHPWSFHMDVSDQISSRPISPKWWWFSRGNGNPRLFQGNPGWWNIIPFGQMFVWYFDSEKTRRLIRMKFVSHLMLKHSNLWWKKHLVVFSQSGFQFWKRFCGTELNPSLGIQFFQCEERMGQSFSRLVEFVRISFAQKKTVLQYVGCGPLPGFQWQMKV